MAGHAVVVVGGGPTGLMLAGEFALAGTDVAVAERVLRHVMAQMMLLRHPENPRAKALRDNVSEWRPRT